MKQFFKTSAILLTVALILSSCATIVSGTSTEIVIRGQQDEPVNITTYRATHRQVMLPYVLEVRRTDLNERISVTSDHYVYQDFIPGQKINGWIWGNILLFNFIGLGIDATTGAFYETKRDAVELQYKPKTEQQ